MNKIVSLSIVITVFAITGFATNVEAGEKLTNLPQAQRIIWNEAIPLTEIINRLPEKFSGMIAVLPAYHDQRGFFKPAQSKQRTSEIFFQELKDAHREYLNVSLKSAEKLLQEGQINSKQLQRFVKDLQFQLDILKKDGDIPIVGMELVLTPELRQSLEETTVTVSSVGKIRGECGVVDDIPDWVEYINETDNGESDGNVDDTPSQSHSGSGWTPYGGTTNVQREYADNWFIFSSLSSFNSSSTYEHETIFYNKGFAKSGSYHSSNLPSWYRDCLESSSSYDKFTIGTLQAQKMTTNTWYHTYFDLSPETSGANTSNTQINAQIGHRYPSWCYSCYCAWADISCQLTRNFTAPTGFSWQRGTTCID